MKISKTKKYQLIISAIFLSALLYLVSRLDFSIVPQEIRESNKVFLSLGLLSLISAAMVKIFRLSLIGRHFHHTVSYSDASLIQMVGISIATLTPVRIGEGSKAVLLNKRLGVPFASSLGIVVFERLFDIFLLGLGATLFSFFILRNRISFIIGIFLISLIILFLIIRRHIKFLSRFLPEKYRDHLSKIKRNRDPKQVLAFFALTTVAWLFEAGFPWLITVSMDVSVPFHLIFGIVCLSTLSIALSVLPAGIGTLDLSFLVLLNLIGLAPETALSILLIYRFFGIAIPFILTLIIINYHGLSFKVLRSELGR